MQKFLLISIILLALIANSVTTQSLSRNQAILDICVKLGIQLPNLIDPSICLGNCSTYKTVSQDRTHFQKLCYAQKIYYPFIAASDGKYYCVCGNITVTTTTPYLGGTSFLAYSNSSKTVLTKTDLFWYEYDTAAALVAEQAIPWFDYASLIVSQNDDGYVLVGCPIFPFNTPILNLLLPPLNQFTSVGMVCTYDQKPSPATVSALLATAPNTIYPLQNLVGVDQTGCPPLPSPNSPNVLVSKLL